MKLDAYKLMPHTKLNSKWIKNLNLNVRPESIKLKRKHRRKAPGHWSDFLAVTPKAEAKRAKRQTELCENFKNLVH